MILSLAVLTGLLLCLAVHRKRAGQRIAAISLGRAWLAILAVGLQIPLLRAPFGPTQQVAVQQLLFLLSHLLLLAFVWHNRTLFGIQLAGIGIVCNLLVILANGGLMPITPETLVQLNPGTSFGDWMTGFHYGFSKDVILTREATRLWVLSDVLVVAPPFPWPAAFSLGDVAIALGVVALLQGKAERPVEGGAASQSVAVA